MPGLGNLRAPNPSPGLVASRIATLNARAQPASDAQVAESLVNPPDLTQQQLQRSDQHAVLRERAVQEESSSQVTPLSAHELPIARNFESEVSELPLLAPHQQVVDNKVASKRQRIQHAKDSPAARRQHQAKGKIDTGAAGHGGAQFERVASGSMVPIGVTFRQQAEPLSPWARMFTRSKGLLERPCGDCAAKNKSSSRGPSSSTKSAMRHEPISGTGATNSVTEVDDGDLKPAFDHGYAWSDQEDQGRQPLGRESCWPTVADMAMLISNVDEVIHSHGDELRRIVEVMDPHSSFDDGELLRHGFTGDLSYIQGLHSSGWMELIAEVEDAIHDWRGRFASPSSDRRVRFLSLDEEEELARAQPGEHRPKWRPHRAPTGFAEASMEPWEPQIDEESDNGGVLK